MTWLGLVWKNLLRRPARTALTAAGVAIGVALIVALLSITAGVHRTASDLIHVGRADFGLFQADVTDFARSNLPDTIGAGVARTPGVSQIARIKLLVTNDTLVFGLNRGEFAYRRLVVVDGNRGRLLAGDHSGHHVGDAVTLAGRHYTVAGIYHSGDRFEDIGFVLPLGEVQGARE